MILSDFYSVALFHFTLNSAPTTNMLYMLSILVRYKFSDLVKFVLGISIANAIYVCLTVYGIAELKKLSQGAEIILRLVCFGLLFYFGVKILMDTRKYSKDTTLDKTNEPKAENFILRGFVLTMANPKAMVLYPMILVPFINHTLTTLDKVYLSTWFILSTPLYIIIKMYILHKFAIEKLRKFLFKFQWWFGLVLIGVALFLGVSAVMKYLDQ